MLALLSVWIALATLALAGVMVGFRPAFTDVTVVLVLYFGAPGAMCLAGLVLWESRRDTLGDPGVSMRRLQSKVAIALSLIAAAAVYGLIFFSKRLEGGGG